MLLVSAPVVADNTIITVTDAWVRAAPPTVSMHAGYATLKNTSDKPVSLVKVTSPQFGSVQVHESFIENGMAKMRHVAELVIKPGVTVHLAPGGYHLMLMQANTAIETGQQITFIFHFSNGETVKVTAPVQRAATQQTGHKTHHHGH
ncbi:MAG TPA: copper chaperone PCu(A)C [Gammaproteobacteria bacterium]|nr:copper chaperone PCu(A)C [Gammaproteobacteria bacterium]